VEDIDLVNQVVHVRRGIWKGRELAPKTDSGYREIDVDETLTEMLGAFIGTRKTGRLFQTRKGTPLAHGNLRNRVLHPLLERLGIPRRASMPSAIRGSPNFERQGLRRICRSSGSATARFEPATATAIRTRSWTTARPQRLVSESTACLDPTAPSLAIKNPHHRRR
jgi:hypothetical protein